MTERANVLNAELHVGHQCRYFHDEHLTQRGQRSVQGALWTDLYLNRDLYGAGLWGGALTQSRTKFACP